MTVVVAQRDSEPAKPVDAGRPSLLDSAKKAADSLRRSRKPRTAYSISKESHRLAEAGVVGVRPVSSNTIRDNAHYAVLLSDPLERRVFRPADRPKDMERMTRSEAIEQARIDRELAELNSSRVIELENENAQLKLQIRELRKLL